MVRDPPGADTIASRPDGSTQVVADQGLPVKQDADGTQIQRLGIAGAEADWGPESGVDISNGGEYKIANPDQVGGTEASSGIIRSENSANFSLVYAWTDGDNDIDTVAAAESDANTVIERPPEAQSTTDVVIEELKTKSDHCDVFVEDESGGANTIAYTLNFH
jgi:hypothetical protein